MICGAEKVPPAGRRSCGAFFRGRLRWSVALPEFAEDWRLVKAAKGKKRFLRAFRGKMKLFEIGRNDLVGSPSTWPSRSPSCAFGTFSRREKERRRNRLRPPWTRLLNRNSGQAQHTVHALLGGEAGPHSGLRPICSDWGEDERSFPTEIRGRGQSRLLKATKAKKSFLRWSEMRRDQFLVGTARCAVRTPPRGVAAPGFRCVGPEAKIPCAG
jgi:hypothetical protein